MGQQDESAWARLLSGDARAFGELFDRHHPRLLAHSSRLASCSAEADDIVAVVFLEAWRKRNSVRFIDGSMLPWLLATANYTAKNLSRSARRYRSALARLPVAAAHEDSVDFGDGAAESALRLMPVKDRQVITLCIIEGLSDGEAAALLRIPVGTVKSRLSRAKRRLADSLAATGLGPIEMVSSQ